MPPPGGIPLSHRVWAPGEAGCDRWIVVQEPDKGSDDFLDVGELRAEMLIGCAVSPFQRVPARPGTRLLAVPDLDVPAVGSGEYGVPVVSGQVYQDLPHDRGVRITKRTSPLGCQLKLPCVAELCA